MKAPKYPLQGIPLAILASFVALSALFALNFVQMMSFVILPFSRKVFRKLNTSCAALWWALCYYFGKVFFKTKIEVVGDVLPPKENAIVLANHQQMPDVFGIFEMALRTGMLPNCKWFAKASLKFVPGMGWGLYCIDSIFLERDWESDKEKVVRYLGKFKRDKIPLWLISFPEGTRMSKEKLRRSQEFAKSKGLPVLNRLLLPRTKGFVTSVKGLRDHCRAVYVLGIHYKSGVSSLWHWLRGLGGDIQMTVHRFSIESLPLADADLSAWLIERFREMDAELLRAPQA